MGVKPLDRAFQPWLITFDLACSEADLRAAEIELRGKCEHDDNQCYGYFPAMRGRGSVDTNLPRCEAFAASMPGLVVRDKKLQFNFIRMSLVQQRGDAPFHLDSDAATALTGDTTTVAERLVWRLLLNVSDQHARTLAYVDVDPVTTKLTSEGGYIHCEDKAVTSRLSKSIAIPPRQGLRTSGVLFCASRVLHTGQDDEHGHFVMGYGCEEAATS